MQVTLFSHGSRTHLRGLSRPSKNYSLQNKRLSGIIASVSKRWFSTEDSNCNARLRTKGFIPEEARKRMAHPDYQDNDGNTRLHRLLFELPNFPCEGEDLSGLNKALDEIENFNLQNRKGWSYLHLAALRQRPDIALKLLQNGADPTTKTKEGYLPIQIALYRRNPQLLSALMAFGTPLPDNFNPHLFYAKMTNDLQNTIFQEHYYYWNYANCSRGITDHAVGNPYWQMYSIFSTHTPPFPAGLKSDKKIDNIMREIKQYFRIYESSEVVVDGEKRSSTPMGRSVIQLDIKKIEELATAGYHPLIEDQILLSKEQKSATEGTLGYCEAMRLGDICGTDNESNKISIGKPKIPIDFFKQVMNCFVDHNFSGISHESEFTRSMLQYDLIDGQMALLTLESFNNKPSIDLSRFLCEIYRRYGSLACLHDLPIPNKNEIESILEHAYQRGLLNSSIGAPHVRYWQQRPIAEHNVLLGWLKDQRAIVDNVNKLGDEISFSESLKYVKEVCLPCLKRYDIDTEDTLLIAERLDAKDFGFLDALKKVLTDKRFLADPRAYMEDWTERRGPTHIHYMGLDDALNFLRGIGHKKYVNLHKQVAHLVHLFALINYVGNSKDGIAAAISDWKLRIEELQKLPAQAETPDVIAIENVDLMVNKARKILNL